jgi:hypothetical protein
MKKFQLKLIIPLCLLLICAVYACQKKGFLDKPALGKIDPVLLANKAGVESLLIGAYSELDGYGGNGTGQSSAPSNWLFGSMAGGDAYKGSDPSDGAIDFAPVASSSEISTNNSVAAKFASLYDGVQRANDVLRGIPNAKDLTADDIKRISAEARFLRGYFYFELRRNFFMVPYVDEATSTDAIYTTKNDKDIYPMIEADFKFAADNLPETQPQKARANKYAAMAYQAKVFMAEAKYTEALAILTPLIANGKTAGGLAYALNDHFQQNFSPEAGQKNSAESVFAVQASVNDGSIGNDSNQGDNLNFPYNGGPGGCCGFFNPSQWLANSYKTDAAGLPLLDDFNSAPTVTDVTYTGTLDPRIDITMGRKGIPYLDWGPHPGDAWIRNPGSDGHFSPKKNVYSKSEVGTNTSTENTWTSALSTSNNVNLIRFSDVLLWAAECEVEKGDLANALIHVNLVRKRAGIKSGWVYLNSPYDASKSIYTVQTTPAANYLVNPYPAFPTQDYARKAVRFERKLELAMEGHRWFDLQRWGSAYMSTELNAFFTSDQTIDITLKGAKFQTGQDEYRPLPQAQIDIANSKGPIVLKQNPGY